MRAARGCWLGRAIDPAGVINVFSECCGVELVGVLDAEVDLVLNTTKAGLYALELFTCVRHHPAKNCS
jgi:hypothetical protein